MSDLQKSKNGNWVIPNSFQTPNFLVDELMFYLTPEETCCLVYAIRHILGWQDKIVERKARISISSFRRAGLGQTATRTALKSLNLFGILMPEGEPTHDGQMLKLQEEETAIDWEGLRQRRTEKDAKDIARTMKAGLLNPKHRGVSSDEPLSSDDRGGVSCDDRGGGIVRRQH